MSKQHAEESFFCESVKIAVILVHYSAVCCTIFVLPCVAFRLCALVSIFELLCASLRVKLEESLEHVCFCWGAPERRLGSTWAFGPLSGPAVFIPWVGTHILTGVALIIPSQPCCCRWRRIWSHWESSLTAGTEYVSFTHCVSLSHYIK